MFISVVLNMEYADTASRSKWYLKNLLHCKENGWIMITHEYLWKHFDEIQKDITPRLFTDFEMCPFTPDEVKDVEQYFIPDQLFIDIEEKYGTRTEALFQLISKENNNLRSAFQNIIDEIKKNHPNEKIEGVFHTLEAWKSIQDVCKYNSIPLIPYSFSALRKPHGYRQTLYYANLDGLLTTTKETKNRYLKYQMEKGVEIPVFSNREIIAIFGKERTLPLLSLLNADPQYEMGICTECYCINPYFFVHDKISDDDLRYECEKIYDKSQISVRNHALQIDNMQLDRTLVHNDPAAWILSCRRLAAARSQIGLKILLWNRTAIIKADTLEFSFLCEKDYRATTKVDLEKLNYFIFGYLIPNDLMFLENYWKWRMTTPSETDIYQRHLSFYINKLNLPQSILTENDEPTRFKSILQSRGCDDELINILLEDKQDFEIDYNTASSRIVVNGKSYWRLNKKEDGIRHFHIELKDKTNSFDFYPLDDVAGCSRLVEINVNGAPIDVAQYTEYKYMPKVSGHYTLLMPNNDDRLCIDIKWEYMSNNEFLKACQC